jgi:hypothetical protein
MKYTISLYDREGQDIAKIDITSVEFVEWFHGQAFQHFAEGGIASIRRDDETLLLGYARSIGALSNKIRQAIIAPIVHDLG